MPFTEELQVLSLQTGISLLQRARPDEVLAGDAPLHTGMPQGM